MSTWWNIVTRKKRLDPATLTEDTQLARVLSTFDLTALGVGSTLGVGVYVIAGHVAKDTAGPAVVLSFLIAALASVAAGLCYAEFGARVPKAGSAYIYSYVCVGEFVAFVIGWNLILEYVIGTASVARGLSVYIDSLVNNTMSTTFRRVAPIPDIGFMSPYFDFFSCGMTLVLGVAMSLGLKESSLANNIFTSINVLVVLFVIVAGAFKANPSNWSITENIPSGYGKGGFFPYGIQGMIKGAATCFYGFVGFDCIATTGEEARNPQRAIPLAIIFSLFIVFLSYFGTSTIVTMLLPYFEQDANAPIPHAFQVIGWEWARWIVCIGGIFGLCASLFGAMFPLPRIIYAMASDELLFRFMGKINTRFQTPFIGTVVASILTGLMSALFDLNQLVDMMSIGTLMAYSIVAACILILRFSVNEEGVSEWQYALLSPTDSEGYSEHEEHGYSEQLELIPAQRKVYSTRMVRQAFNWSQTTPSYLTQKLVTLEVTIFSLLCLALAIILKLLEDDLATGNLRTVVPTAIIVFLILGVGVSIAIQPRIVPQLTFKVPLVPFIPLVSIAINLYLMMMLDTNTWIRFGVWLVIGLIIYGVCFTLYERGKYEEHRHSIYINYGYNSDLEKNGKLTIPRIIIDPPSDYQSNESAQDPSESETMEKEISRACEQLDKVLNNTDCGKEEESDDSESKESESYYTEVLVHAEDVKEPNDESINASKKETQITSPDLLKQLEDSDYSEAINKTTVNVSEENCQQSLPDLLTQFEDPSIDVQVLKTVNTVDVNTVSGSDSLVLVEDPVKDVTLVTEDVNEASSFEADTNNSKEKGSVETSAENVMKNVPNTKEADEVRYVTVGDINYCHGGVKSDVPELRTNVSDAGNATKSDAEANLTKLFIPLPPPMPDFSRKNSQTLPSPVKAYPKVTPQTLDDIQLRPTSIQAPRARNDSTPSYGSINNLKAGTEKYKQLKNNLNNMLKSMKPIVPPERKYQTEELLYSGLNAERELEKFDQVLEEFEVEIPQDFGRTEVFKETLNELLRRHSSNMKRPNFVGRIESIKRAGSVRNMKDNAQSEFKIKKDDGKSPEMDREEHKKLMFATLKSIKLKKTGIHLDDEETNTI